MTLVRPPSREGITLEARDGESLRVDATVGTAADQRFAFTRRTVEARFSIASGARLEPQTLSLQAVWTDYPMAPYSGEAARGRAERARDRLIAMARRFVLIDVVRPTRVHLSMAIARIGEVSGAGRGEVRLELELQEVRQARVEYIEVPADLVAELDRARSSSAQDAARDRAAREAAEAERRRMKERVNNGTLLHDLLVD